MSAAARTGFIGLVTNVACTQAPEGALQEAENVVLRRVGCVEPREGVRLRETNSDPAVWGFSLDDDEDVIALWGGLAFSWKLVGGAALQYTNIVDGSLSDPQPMRRDVLTYARARGYVYVPFTDGTHRLTTSGFSITGVPQVARFVGSSFAGGTWLANNEQVAYRLVLRSTVDGGMIIRSVPTVASTVSNTSGGATRVVLSVSYHQRFQGDFDAIEVYRTRNFATSITPDDDMQLVGVMDQSQFSLTGTLYTAAFTDDVAPAQRGMTLYTSPSRGGILEQNDRPPAAACVAAYKGSLFFGGVRGPQRKVVTYRWGGDVSGSATGVGLRLATGDVTNGSAIILNVTPTTGLERGMIFTTLGLFPENTYVTNISGTTVTVSAVATGLTTVGAPMGFYDAIKVDGLWLNAENYPFGLGAHGSGEFAAYGLTPARTGLDITLVIESVSRAVGAETIQATHGSEYDPPLPNYLGTPLELDQDDFPGAIMWSKIDEPEHVPTKNYQFVGDKGKAVLGLVPTRDALFVLKEDGVFRLTGSGATEGIASPWRVDPYDPTTRCLLPTSVRPLNGRVYFLSNKGVVAFGDDGAEVVSRAVYDLVRYMLDEVAYSFQQNGFYELNGVVGSTAAVFERENEYTIMRSSEERPLVYNENTNAWTMWRYWSQASEMLAFYRGVFFLEREGRVAYSLGDSFFETRLSTDAPIASLGLAQRYDSETAVTATSYGSGFVTLSAPVTALADDVIQDADGKLWRITVEVGPHDVLTVVGAAGATFTTGSCVLYRSLRCQVAPQTFYSEPMRGKDNSPLTAVFSRFHGPVALSCLYSSVLSPLDWDAWEERGVAIALGADGFAVNTRGWALSHDVPNSHRRAWLLDAGLRWVITHGDVRLEGLYIESRPMTPRAKPEVAA